MTTTPTPAPLHVDYDEVLSLAYAAVQLHAAYGAPRGALTGTQFRTLTRVAEAIGHGAELRLDDRTRAGLDRAVNTVFAELTDDGSERFHDLCHAERLLVMCPDPQCQLSNGITAVFCQDCGIPLPRDFAAEEAERHTTIMPMPGDVVRLTAVPDGWTGPLPLGDAVIDGVGPGHAYRYPDDHRAELVFAASVFRGDGAGGHTVRCFEGAVTVRIDLVRLRATGETRTVKAWRHVPGRAGRFAYQATVNLWEADPDAIIPARRAER